MTDQPASDALTDLPALLAKAKAATPGPWNTRDKHGRDYGGGHIFRDGELIAGFAGRSGPTVDRAEQNATAEFVAAADPTTIAALVEELMRARELIQALAAESCEDPPTLDNWTCSGCLPCSARTYLAARKEAERG